MTEKHNHDHTDTEASTCDCENHNHTDSGTEEKVCDCGHHDHKESNTCASSHHHHNHTDSGAGPSACGCGHNHATNEEDFLREKIITGVSLLLVILAVIIEHFFENWYYLAITFALIALALTAYPIFREAYQGLRDGGRNVNELVAIAIIGAVVLGEFIIAAEVAVIITIGELIESWAYNRSRRDIESIVSNNPRYGYRIREDTNDHADGDSHSKKIEEISVDNIIIGDKLLIRPGDVAPVDGIVLEGTSYLDESCLTGESVPQEKRKGDTVYSGSINYDGALTIKATKRAEDSTYAEIVALIHEAGERRPPTRLFINQFAQVYTPVILVIAAAILLISRDPIRAITVLIVACPCALLFATPSVVLTAIGSAAKKGIIIKSGELLEICSSISVVLFDKTGTLTSGKMEVTDIVPLPGVSEQELLSIAGEVESTSSHPIAQAILRTCQNKGIEPISATGHMMHPGLGVQAASNGTPIYAGSKAFLEQNGVSHFSTDVPDKANSGGIEIWVAKGETLLGSLCISDTIRPESEEIVRSIRKLGIGKIGMMTGDASSSVSAIAQKAGLSKELIRSGMLPEEKREFIEHLQQREDPSLNTKKEAVCFIGDGTNDGPALAQADIGVSIASRSDTVALKTAHVVLMREGLAQLPTFFTLGMRSKKTITANVVLALGINIIMIVLAASGLLSPAMGAIGHQAGMIAVVVNSARLAMIK